MPATPKMQEYKYSIHLGILAMLVSQLKIEMRLHISFMLFFQTKPILKSTFSFGLVVLLCCIYNFPFLPQVLRSDRNDLSHSFYSRPKTCHCLNLGQTQFGQPKPHNIFFSTGIPYPVLWFLPANNIKRHMSMNLGVHIRLPNLHQPNLNLLLCPLQTPRHRPQRNRL
jgi:hypothetical protein